MLVVAKPVPLRSIRINVVIQQAPARLLEERQGDVKRESDVLDPFVPFVANFKVLDKLLLVGILVSV